MADSERKSTMPDDEKRTDEATHEPDEAAAERDRPPLPVASFTTFLQGLAGQCLIALGVLPNPATGEKGADLEQAKYSIDLMQIIEEKTKGNLTDEEQKLLGGLLYDLRMRYVDACRT